MIKTRPKVTKYPAYKKSLININFISYKDQKDMWKANCLY